MKKIRRSVSQTRKKNPGKTGPAAKSSIAVAIENQAVRLDALPKIVATGRGNLADKILEIAFAEGVRVREDADLAEMLAAADLDSEIPVEAFIAVAEILRYVYGINAKESPEVDQL